MEFLRTFVLRPSRVLSVVYAATHNFPRSNFTHTTRVTPSSKMQLQACDSASCNGGDWKRGIRIAGPWQSLPIVAQIRVHNNLPKPDTKSNPNPNPNSNPTTKKHAIVNIKLNIVTCPTYPDKLIRDMLLHRLCDFTLWLSHCPKLHDWKRKNVYYGKPKCTYLNARGASKVPILWHL